MIDNSEFDEASALEAALGLQKVLQMRTHKRKYLGQYYEVPGKLGEALRLPSILSKLGSKVVKRRQQGVEEFNDLWITLSKATQQRVLELMSWYDPKELEWDDKRSNRKPKLPSDS